MYKLRIMGIPLEVSVNVFCDKNSVVMNNALPEYNLKKKHVSIFYHLVREVCASHLMMIKYENSEYNLADILTKLIPVTNKIELV